MKVWEVLGIGVAAIVALKYLPLFGAGNKLNVVFAGVDLNNSTVHLTAQNTTDTAIVLNSLAADISFDASATGGNFNQADATDLGNVSMFTPVTIAPNAATDIPLNFSLSPLGLISAATTSIQGAPQLNFNVNGSMNVAGVSLPLNLTKSVLWGS